MQNPPENLEDIVLTENQVKMFVPLYDTNNGEFLGVKQTLGYVMLRGDPDETFLLMATMKKNLVHFFVPLNSLCLMFLLVLFSMLMATRC